MSRQSFVNMALSYFGTKEGSVNHKYIIDTYNKIVPLPQGYKVKYTDAWCATFVSFCAHKCGMLNIIPAECSCPRQIELWKKLGRWVEDDAYVPDVGDIVYYYFKDNGKGDCVGDPDHVGIVVSVIGKSIRVIEGNINDSVGYRIVNIDGKYIRGYGLPAFKKNSGGVFNLELKILKKGSSGEQVRALQILLMGRGYKMPKYGADGDYGDETVKAVKAFQKAVGISVDGIAGSKTFSKLLGI